MFLLYCLFHIDIVCDLRLIVNKGYCWEEYGREHTLQRRRRSTGAFLGGMSKASWEVDATATISLSEEGPPTSSSYLLWYLSGDLDSISLSITHSLSLSLLLLINQSINQTIYKLIRWVVNQLVQLVEKEMQNNQKSSKLECSHFRELKIAITVSVGDSGK